MASVRSSSVLLASPTCSLRLGSRFAAGLRAGPVVVPRTEAAMSKTACGAEVERKLLRWLGLLNSLKQVSSQVLLLQTNPEATGKHSTTRSMLILAHECVTDTFHTDVICGLDLSRPKQACVQRKGEELGCTHRCCDLACKSSSRNMQVYLAVYTSNYLICVWKNRVIVCKTSYHCIRCSCMFKRSANEILSISN